MTDTGPSIADAFPDRPLARKDLEAIRDTTPSSLELEIGSEIDLVGGQHTGITVLLATARSREVLKIFGYHPAEEEWRYLEEFADDANPAAIDDVVAGWDELVAAELESE